MAVFVYKDGQRELVDPHHLENMLAGGWSVVPEEDEGPTIADMRTPKQVRDEAKEAGIETWETARIATLKAFLNEHKD